MYPLKLEIGREAKVGESLEFKSRLVYRVSSRTGYPGLHREIMSQNKRRKEEQFNINVGENWAAALFCFLL